MIPKNPMVVIVSTVALYRHLTRPPLPQTVPQLHTSLHPTRQTTANPLDANDKLYSTIKLRCIKRLLELTIITSQLSQDEKNLKLERGCDTQLNTRGKKMGVLVCNFL